MQDDYVCGADYENCLDPSGKYIVNGQIVVGSMPGKPITSSTTSSSLGSGMWKSGLYKTWCTTATSDSCTGPAWDYDGGSNGDLAKYINDTLYTGGSSASSTSYPSATDLNMSKFLQFKIGYNKDGKNYGMCMSVLNKCQDYTYNKDRTYLANNNVIKEYLYRTMIQIKAAQDAVLSNYAENCVSEVVSCLSSNNYEASDTSQTIAVNACKSQIMTCMSVNGDITSAPSPSAMASWAQDVYDGTIVSTSGN